MVEEWNTRVDRRLAFAVNLQFQGNPGFTRGAINLRRARAHDWSLLFEKVRKSDSLLILTSQQSFGINGGCAAHAGCGDGLAIHLVRAISGYKDASHIGA